jgi:ribosome-binding factor A
MKDRNTRGLRDLCAQPTDEDGRDPRLDRKDSSRSKANRKDLSLCKQVMRTLDLELAGWPWAIDAGLWIVGVEPAPDATCLRVHVAWTIDSLGRLEVLDRLGARAPSLRAAVAAAITRKRAPRLEFEAAPPATAPHESLQSEEDRV